MRRPRHHASKPVPLGRLSPRPLPLAVLLAAMLLSITAHARAAKLALDRPTDREFVRDHASLLGPADLGQVRQRCDQLLTDTRVPMFVLTLNSLADAGVAGMSLEAYARMLMEDWSHQTHPLTRSQDWSNGILLVVSLGDRRTRIQLGAQRTRSNSNAEAQRVINQHILPAFRAGDYARGIAAGVDALDQMARGKPVPPRPVPARVYLYWAVFAGLAVFTMASLARRGNSGWAWVFWSAVFVALGALLYHLTTPNSRSPRGGWIGRGGFSSGSRPGRGSGGGSGGGASWSW